MLILEESGLPFHKKFLEFKYYLKQLQQEGGGPSGEDLGLEEPPNGQDGP